jgi:hypothetical protein
MQVHALIFKPPEVYIIELRLLNKSGQLNVDFLQPVHLGTFPLQVWNPVQLELIHHIDQG